MYDASGKTLELRLEFPNGLPPVSYTHLDVYKRQLKIRTMENPMHIAFFKELGANPTPMSWGELYTALQQGTVDAQENTYACLLYTSRCV